MSPLKQSLNAGASPSVDGRKVFFCEETGIPLTALVAPFVRSAGVHSFQAGESTSFLKKRSKKLLNS
jgi:hypothetical protein